MKDPKSKRLLIFLRYVVEYKAYIIPVLGCIKYKPNGGNTMAYVITDNCVSCGTCAANCPAEAIDMGDDKYVIDQDKCVSCGTCKENCPADAIVEE